MATTTTTIPALRAVRIYDATDLPVGDFYCPADPVEGYHGFGEGETGAGARSRNAEGRHGVRLSIVESGAEVDRIFTHSPREFALADVAAHPGRQYGLLQGVVLRNSSTGASITVA
jgi:hypothetical protein